MLDQVRFKRCGTDLIREVKGKEARTLLALLKAGERGVSVLDARRWALRLAAYIFELRGKGLVIETARERHSGRDPGWHGRYTLRSKIELVEQG
jgi:hypothetical protein